MSVEGWQPPAVAETHSAWVFMVGDRAYKLKKPLDLGFLDFSTREARERVCHREVELNRRLAPDVYLGVYDVVDADGRPVDHLVAMRRLPDARRLETLIRSGVDQSACVRSIARQLATFHSATVTSLTGPEIARPATRDAVAANWADNFAAIDPYVGDVIDADEFGEVQTLATRYLIGRARLFAHRIDTGQVRDGHGDLQAQDIFCLDDGPRIIDCLEFDDRYRFGDVLLDAGFLAMDLERIGPADAASTFLQYYCQFSNEHHPETLAHHYIAYRAHVRAKVTCLRHAQGDAAAASEARVLHGLARDHLRAGRVRLVLVGGLPATGKSTLATRLSDATGWSLLRTDEVRKDLLGVGHHVAAGDAFAQGAYTPARVARVYEEVLGRARRLLELGEPVIIDASWSSASHRRAAADVAVDTASDLVQLRCDAPLPVAHERLQHRSRRTTASDATPDVLTHMAERFDAWPAAFAVDTSRSREMSLDTALAHCRADDARATAGSAE